MTQDTDNLPSVVVFLGNPGVRYAKTRHNVAWWVADVLSKEMRREFAPGWGNFHYATLEMDRRTVHLVKPTTYMNLSGHALIDLAERVEFHIRDVIAVADDFALPLGQLRIRKSGSSGGHNGLASLIEVFESDQFTRLRCGVGPVPEGIDPADFVLAEFVGNELSSAQDMAERAASAVKMIVTAGATRAANTYNRKPPAPEAPSGDQSGA